MKTKLFIIGTFAIGWGWWYLENRSTATQSEPVRPVDTVAVVSNYLLKYSDSTKVALTATMESELTDTYEANLAEFQRLDAIMDSLIDVAGKRLNKYDFEQVIIKIVDNQ